MRFHLSIHLLCLVAVLFTAQSFAQPVISSFTPASGPVGTSVTITGSNFSATAANNTVYFGSVKANVTAASTTSLTVVAPAGTTYRPISVTVNNLTAYSSLPFIVTFTGGLNITQNADGSTDAFETPFDSLTGLLPNAAAIVDFDGDGKPDIATANNHVEAGTTASISILRNTGSPGAISYTSFQDITTSALTYAIATGDLDGDGKQDMATCHANSDVLSVFRNTSSAGTITFAPKIDFPTGTSPFGIAISDVNGDGKPDIIVSSFFSGTVSVYRNTSTPGNISLAAKVDFNSEASTRCVAVGDLDGDNKPDLAVTNSFSNNVFLFRNTSSGSTISFAARVSLNTNSEPGGVAIGDLNADGKADIVVANRVSQDISIFRNMGTAPGSFSFTARSDRPAGSIYNVSIGDLNGDGKPDIVASGTAIGIFQNTSSPASNVTVNSVVKIETFPCHSTSIGDVDMDGKNDLVGAAFTSDRVILIRNKGNEPTVKSFTPNGGVAGTTVTITGNNFTGITGVNFGGVPATSFTVVNSTTITAVVGNGSSGNVAVTNANGTNRKDGFIFHAPPTIISFTPASGAQGATITITGTYLSTTTAVKFGGVNAQSFNIVSPTTVTARVANGASGDISITTPYGTANLAGFTYIPPPPPVITSFTPTQGGTGTSITIRGERFTGVTAVKFGGVNAQSYNVTNVTTITARPAAGATGEVSVTTPDGTATMAGFTYIPPPVITSFTPGNAHPGATVTITGENFVNVTAVRFGGTLASSFTTVSPTTITAIVGTGASGDVTVTTAYGTVTSPGFIFNPPPAVHNFTPQYGGAGETISITGVNFTGATAVTFGNIPVQSFSVVSPGLITAVLGTGASGAIRVTTPYGTGALGSFIYKFPPTITSMTPMSSGNGLTVTITGTNFEPLPQTTTVTFGGVPATSVTVVNTTTITAVVGTGASGDVAVSTQWGTATLPGFTWVPLPVISSFSPTSANAGSVITITGNNFSTTSAITLGNAGVSSFNIVNNTTITVFVGSGSSGDVKITSAGGTASLAGFTFVPSSAPVITSVAPLTGPIGSTVVITGTGFDPDPARNYVYFGAVRATITAASATSLSATVPLGASYAPVKVTTHNLTAASAKAFSASFAGGSNSFTSNSFTGPVEFSADGVGSIFTPVPADFDNDGKPDMVVAGAGGLTIHQNISTTGNINFATRTVIHQGQWSEDVVTADMDGDGKLDIIHGEGTGAPSDVSTLSIARNTSSNGTISFSNYTFPSLQIPLGLGVADIDADGKPDVVVATNDNGRIMIYRNTTLGSTLNFVRTDIVPGDGSAKIALDDIDGDGKIDIIMVNAGNTPPNRYCIFVFRNLSTAGTISFAPPVPYGFRHANSVVKTGDLDGDGRPEIVVSNSNGSAIYPNLSTPGTINMGTKYDLAAYGSMTWGLDITDMDGDGKPDITLAEYWLQDSIDVFKNLSVPGSLSFGPRVNYSLFTDLPRGLMTNDLDMDGKPDIAVASFLSTSPNTSAIAVLRNTTGSDMMVCAGNSITLNAATTGTQYQWQVNTGSGFTSLSDNSNYSGSATNALQITNVPAAWNNYQYRCLVNTVAGPAKTLIVETTVKPSGTATTSAPTICTGANFNITFTAANIVIGSTLQLMESVDGGAFVQVQAKPYSGVPDVFTISTNTVVATKRYYIRMISARGHCTEVNNTDIITVTVGGTNPVSTATSPAAACVNENFNVAFNSANTPNGSTVQLWQSINNAAYTSVQSMTYNGTPLLFAINANIAAATKKYFFRVTTTGPCGVTKNSDTTTTVVSHLATPVITDNNEILTLTNPDPAASYKWQKLNAVNTWEDIIPAATGNTYIVTATNGYRVFATKGTCTATSNVITIIIPDPLPSGNVTPRLYPNPVISNNFTIDSLLISAEWQTLQIAGMDGRIIKTIYITGVTSIVVPVGDLMNGFYTAILRRRNGSSVYIRFVKL